MPYLSMLLHTGLTADCTGLEIEPETGNLLQIRPAIGGNIMATIKTPDTRPQMCTVRPKSFELWMLTQHDMGKLSHHCATGSILSHGCALKNRSQKEKGTLHWKKPILSFRVALGCRVRIQCPGGGAGGCCLAVRLDHHAHRWTRAGSHITARWD